VEAAKLKAHLILAGLQRIVENGPKDYSLGLCQNLEDAIEELPEYSADVADSVLGTTHVPDWLEDELNCGFMDWPLFAGSLWYPVPYPTLGRRVAYDAYDTEPKWDKEQPYGQNRWNLVHFLVQYFEEKLQSA
jgi:hypothetical protein